jgi:hypothetical protein
MIRAAATVLFLGPILLLGPSLAAGQGVPGERRAVGEVSHTVGAGETLGSIARTYYGSAGEWRRIFDANRDRVSDPDRLPVGLTLRIPGTEGPREPARVTEVRVPSQEVPGDPRDRRALLERRPFAPRGVPEPAGERTIFHGTREHAREEQLSQVLILPREAVPAIPAGVALAAGWTIPPGAASGSWGVVPAFSGGSDRGEARTTLLPFDEVRIVLEEGVRVGEGDRLLMARIQREVPGVGRIVSPTAVVEVVRLERGGALGKLVREVGKPELGNLVFPLRTFRMTPGVYPAEVEREFEASVLAFQERKELYLPGDFLFIDRGGSDGLAPGDEFVVLGGTEEEWQGRRMARLQVVAVEAERATLRIIGLDHPNALRPGTTVLLDRKMP